VSTGAESFGVLLREKLAELEADEAPPVFVADDPVERLGLDARQAVMVDHAGPMPRGGAQAYVTPPAPPAEQPRQRHLNILR
jgi:hypothetical protein